MTIKIVMVYVLALFFLYNVIIILNFIDMGKILIVEDDEQLLFIISKYLENMGFPNITALNGKEAIDLLKSNNTINLVIADLIMPVLDGFDLCYYIRSNKDLEDLPILIITGQADMYFKCKAFEAGADDYMIKPVDFVEFMLRIKALLRRSKKDDQNNENLNQNYNYNNVSIKLEDGKTLEINKDTSLIKIENKESYLTSSELDIIQYLIIKGTKPTNTDEILEKVMKYPKGSGNPVSVRTHIRNIRMKIEEDPDNPKVLISIPKRGYIIKID